MLLRDRNPRAWSLSLSPLFERAFETRVGIDDHGWDVLDSLEEVMYIDPRAAGEPHPGFPDENIWIYESPPISGWPQVAVLYEINDERNRVIFWNLWIR